MWAVSASAMMLAGRSDLAVRAVREFGAGCILAALGASWDGIEQGREVWLGACVGDVGIVGEFLTGEVAIPKSMMYGLARELPPEAVPNPEGEDPWLVADRRSVGAGGDSEASYMAAYLLGRAFGEQTRCAGELAQRSFESVHAAIENRRLAYDSWRVVEWGLAWATNWFEWDRGQRLRSGVASLFVERDLAPECFLELCEDDQLFLLVATKMARGKRGRNYLKRVRRSRVAGRDARLALRLRMIGKLLK